MSKRKTKEQFIKEMKLIHNDKYDYSLVEYKNNKTKVDIICHCETNGKEHGVFSQTPQDHKKYGCPTCGIEKRANFLKLKKEEVLKKFKEAHGDKYDYSLVEYVNSKTPVKIICKKHGVFEQIPENHWKGSNCPACVSYKIVDFDFKMQYNYREEYLKLIRNARKNIPNDNYEIHHILPKSMFPLWKNRKSNLVKLSYQDHYKAHYLLYKIYGGKMAIAFWRMFITTKNKYSPKLFEEIKKANEETNGTKIYCYELDREFSSIKKACKELNLKYFKFKKKFYHSKDYHFCRIEDKSFLIEELKNKQIYCYELNKVYKDNLSVREDGFDSSGVLATCKGKQKTHKSYHFCFLKDKEWRDIKKHG